VAHFLKNADLGVTFFFVLSGFLITQLLLVEKELTSMISIKMPVYFIVVFVGFFLIPNLSFLIPLKSQLNFPIDIPYSRLPYFLTFLANTDILINGYASAIVAVLWSVSVEEQFYLIWPVILRFVNKKNLPLILLTIVAISFFYRFYVYNDATALHFSSISVMSYLATGAWVSYYCYTRTAFVRFIENLSRRCLIIIYAAGISFIPLRGFSHIFGETAFHYFCPFEGILFSLFFAFVILEQNYSKNSFYKIGKIKLFAELGKISYGLYSYHMIAILTVLSFCIHFKFTRLFDPKLLFLFEIILSLFVTVLFSKLSYRWIEKRCITLKNKFSVITKE
jgi:peptidoglycan/LPS O-acetylase OafA/YrhL